ncbi:sensor histidine kinase [Streptococcus porcinus]
MIRLFLKEYRIWYVQFLLLIGLYLLVFYLYHLPFIYFFTASLISVSVVWIITILTYIQFRKKIQILQEFIYVTELDELKKPSEKAYNKLISNLMSTQYESLRQEKKKQEELAAIIKIWSHQMKIPLSALSLMVQTNQVTPHDLQNQLLYLENYLNQLLSYFKFTQNKDDFRFEVIEVSDIVKSILKEMSPICFTKEISIKLTGEWQVVSDKKWLRFALLQVIDNAIKYSYQRGQIRIYLKDGIAISDSGIGILEEDLPRLFEEGFTGYNGHEHQKATGLGLFMTKNILSQLNLDIKIDSKIDKGTNVKISPAEKNLKAL